jgi:anti-sigma regulatory factor (Ser/Thr protein kinase)
MALISGVVAGLDIAVDRAEVRFAGELRLGTAADVRRVLAKLLTSYNQVVVDLTGFRLTWPPAAHVFGAALAAAGGWPAARMVLFGADPTTAAELERQRVTRRVPLVTDRAAAHVRLGTRPDAVARHVRLGAEVTAPRAAREFTDHTCADWGLHDIAAGARLVVNELVTNCVEHAATPSDVGLRLDRHGLWIEVRDYRPGTPPRPRPRLVGGEGGRGLHAVAAVALRMDTTRHPDGKTVWALLGTGSL